MKEIGTDPMMRRKQGGYFKAEPGAPDAVSLWVKHRVRFSEVDAMAIAWHGRYLQYFELASEELARSVGLSYEDYFAADLRAPLVQVHVDYHRPVTLGEEIAIQARLVWTDAARLNIEYTIQTEGGETAATGFTVQMFTDATGGAPCFVVPPLLARCRERWRQGEFACL